jgi:hypothetical protein
MFAVSRGIVIRSNLLTWLSDLGTTHNEKEQQKLL